MSYPLNQDMPAYYRPNNTRPSNSMHSSTNSNSSGSPTPSLPSLDQQQQQQPRIKLSPESSPSSLESTSSLSSYPSIITSSGTPLISAASFTPGDDVDMQPLDLSLRAGREEPASKRPRTAEHKPICLVKSCVCNLGNTRAQRLSPYPVLTPGVSRSPNSHFSTSPLSRTDSPYYIQRQTPSPAYYGNLCSAGAASSLYYVPPLPSSSTSRTDSSSFQILTTSDSVLNGISNSTGLFRPYDDHIDSDMNGIPSGPSEAARQQETQHQAQQEEDDEPTYMDLDCSTQKSLYAKNSDGYMEEASTIHNRAQISSLQLARSEAKTQPSPNKSESGMLIASSSTVDRAHCDSSGLRTATHFVGGVISHTSTSSEKHQDHQHGAMYTSEVPTSPDSGTQHRHQQQQQQQQQNIYHPNSSSSPGGVSSSTGHVTTLNLYPNQGSMAYQYQSNLSHGCSSISTADTTRFSTVRESDSKQQQSQALGVNQKISGEKNSPSNKENSSRNKSKKSAASSKTANFFNVPVTTSASSTSGIGYVEAHNKKNEEKKQQQQQQKPQEPPSGEASQLCVPYAGSKINENSSKISLLDLLISKILMERSIEVPRKSCNIDYEQRTTVDGQKKIRLRLVDLIELQVEESLKA